MAGPVIASSNVAFSATATSVAVTKPTGTASGDLLLAFCTFERSAAPTTDTLPSGFAIPSGGKAAWTSASTNYGYVAWKIAGGSEPSTYTFGTNGTVVGGVGVNIILLRITGAGASTPIDAIGATHTTSGSTGAFSNLTTTAANDLIVFFGLLDPSGGTSTKWTDAGPSGATVSTLNNQAGLRVGTYQLTKATAGSIGALTAPTTTLDTGSDWNAITVAILAASGDTNVNLTGASSASAAGSFVRQVSKGPTGAAALSHAGAFAPTAGTNVNLTGAPAASHAGAFAALELKTLTGAPSVSHAGSFTPSAPKSVNLTGAPAASHAGALTPSVLKTLTGVVAASHAGLFAPSKTFALTGASAASHAGTLGKIDAPTLVGCAAASHAGVFGTNGSKQVNLTGVSGASHAGAFAKTEQHTLPGASSVSHAGTFNPSDLRGLTGVLAISHAGSFTPTNAKVVNLTGAPAASHAGIFARTENKPLTGAVAASAAGIFGLPHNFTLVGAQANSHAGAFSRTLPFPSQSVVFPRRRNTVYFTARDRIVLFQRRRNTVVFNGDCGC